MHKDNSEKRDGFSSKFGVIAAMAGSAVGLGNIWRFPYVLGENGGAAFLLVYIVFIFGLGIPILMSELLIGRKAGKNAMGTFKILAPGTKWYWVGIAGVVCSFIILSYYSVVAGWTLHYVYLSVVNGLKGLSAEGISATYESMSESAAISIFWLVVFVIVTAVIVLGGIEKGIEKYSKILMPMLIGIILLMCIRSLTLPGSFDGMVFLFKPDFSKLNPTVVLEALGQACFSLSIGMGIMITYGSYVGKKQNLGSSALYVASTDLLVAVLAAIAIFPAVFAFGINPGQGPGLVFVTLPTIFNQMFGGYFFAILFFILLFIAALTSSISLLEVVVAFLSEEFKIKRRKATIIAAGAVILFGCLSAYSSTVFNIFDKTSANVLLPLGALFIVIFVPLVLKREGARLELEAHGSKLKMFNVVYFIVKFIAPIAILLIFLQQFGLLSWL